MNLKEIESSFKSSVVESIRLLPEGINRYQVFTPFHFDDGDHFVIVLRKDKGDNFFITDEGHTYMHLSYQMDLSSLTGGNRNEIIEGSLEKYGVEDREGNLCAPIDDMSGAGNVLYSFIQCLISITDVSYLSRERVASTFMEDFKEFISETVEVGRFVFDYREPQHDPEGKYLVDCRINGMSRPLHIYAIGSDGKCRDTTISILQFERWSIDCSILGIFEDQEKVGRKVLARFTDVCDRQFSSLAEKKRIGNYIKDKMGEMK